MRETRLTSLDLQRLLTSGANLALETSKVQIEALKGVVNQQSAEIAFLKSQLAMADAGRQTEERRKQAVASQQAAKKAHDDLAGELGKTYQVDWKKSAFCPDTGEIRPVDAGQPTGVGA